jgi:hypothetical protein
VTYVYDQDRESSIADFVDDTIVTDSDAPSLASGEFLGACGPGI